jgi:hypothetical protein
MDARSAARRAKREQTKVQWTFVPLSGRGRVGRESGERPGHVITTYVHPWKANPARPSMAPGARRRECTLSAFAKSPPLPLFYQLSYPAGERYTIEKKPQGFVKTRPAKLYSGQNTVVL